MRRVWKTSLIAAVAATAYLSGTAAQAAPADHHKVHGRHHRVYAHGFVHPGVAYAPSSRAAARRSGLGHGHHFAALVGDPGGGYGFYALPTQYRIGAYRYHLRHQAVPLWDNPVGFAIASDAAGYHDRMPGERGYAGNDMFNPYDGVGTPFFAGYYGPAGDGADQSFPFGRPYTR